MFLQEIFSALESDELSQTNLAPITEAKWARVVMHINLGLGDLFKRFFLREGKLTLTLMPGQTEYPLDMKYAVNNRKTRVAVEDRFIADSVSVPYKNDLLKVDRILGFEDQEVVLNDNNNILSLTTTDTYPVTLHVPADIANQVQDLPDALKTPTLVVMYRAKHPKIDSAVPGFDPELYDVRLPDSHLQALLYYVSSRVLGPAGIGQQEGVSSAGYWKRYEMECTQLQGAGVHLSQTAGFDRLRDRGFA